MNSDPVELITCLLVRDCITSTMHLTVGVRPKGRRVLEEVYEVRVGLDFLLLIKDGGEFYELRPGGSCSCPDAKYRRRLCKHLVATRMAGLLGERQGTDQWTTKSSQSA